MKRLLTVTLVLFSFSPLLVRGQIVGNCTAPYDNATELVNLLVNGVPFSNATLTGFDCSAGYFDGSTSNLSLESGLVMATGGVESIEPGAFGGALGGPGVDADLTEQLVMVGASATNLNNLIVLEFDFIPNSDQIAFQYVFASNEYPGYTCSQFNDIFGFFLSGPGITGPFSDGAVNMALVPDPDDPDSFTDTPVIINTINSGTASFGDSGPCDDIDPNWQDYSVFFTDNTAQETVNFPGFTVPLTATYNVTPCEEYHIKLAIADVADGALNSAVFLLEGSFSSVGLAVDQDSDYGPYVGNDTTLVEGCFDGEIEFELNQAVSTNYVIDYVVSGTATDGIDYEEIGTQVVIPAGETIATIPIVPLYDGMVEGMETLIVSATISDGCTEEDRDFTFNIVDRLELFLDMPTDTAFCPGSDAILLDPYLSGGVYPLTYQWHYNGGLYSNEEEITILPENLGTYTFHAEDLCDSEVYGEIEAYLLEPDIPLAMYTTFTDIEACLDDEFSTEVFLIGGIGEHDIKWYLNDSFYSDSMNFEIPTDVAYDYNFELIVNDECSNTVTQEFNFDIMDCFIPNVFTPNNDGKNDFWYVNFGDVVGNVRVDIYNRWGQLIYNSTHYELCDEETGDYCWKGDDMSSGESCPDGSYYYTIELIDGRRHRGYFNLFR